MTKADQCNTAGEKSQHDLTLVERSRDVCCQMLWGRQRQHNTTGSIKHSTFQYSCGANLSLLWRLHLSVYLCVYFIVQWEVSYWTYGLLSLLCHLRQGSATQPSIIPNDCGVCAEFGWTTLFRCRGFFNMRTPLAHGTSVFGHF